VAKETHFPRAATAARAFKILSFIGKPARRARRAGLRRKLSLQSRKSKRALDKLDHRAQLP